MPRVKLYFALKVVNSVLRKARVRVTALEQAASQDLLAAMWLATRGSGLNLNSSLWSLVGSWSARLQTSW